VILAMPYGCLDSQKLSAASRTGLEKAIERWRHSSQTSRHKTFFVLGSYNHDGGLELSLRKELLLRSTGPDEPPGNIVEISADDEEDLAQRIARTKTLLPIETLTVFAESRHAVSLKPIFRRKFSRAVEVKTFKADFEFHHPWVSASSSLAWVVRNASVAVWFKARQKMGRGLRKKLRFLFRP
jgi:hypothetical protein